MSGKIMSRPGNDKYRTEHDRIFGKAASVLKYRDGNIARLNLGCGDKHIDGFINIDMNETDAADYTGDVSSLDNRFFYIPRNNGDCVHVLPAKAMYLITEIVAYDIIEHFDHVQIPVVLKNWHDHLATNGLLYIRTNDLDRMIRLYAVDKPTFPAEKFIWHLMCEHEKPGMGHKWCFTKRTMIDTLVAAGFTQIDVTEEEKIVRGEYPHSFTNCDLCNMHMVARK